MIERISKILFIALFVWMVASLVDTGAHNTPISGDGQYAPWNMFSIMYSGIERLA